MDEIMRLKSDLLHVTTELISNCRFCTEISANPDEASPISCTKLSGSSVPISVNAATCLSCGEYKQLPDSRHDKAV